MNLVNGKSLAPVAAEALCQPAPIGANNCDPQELGAVQDSNGQSLGTLRAERIDLNRAPFDGILGAPFFSRSRQSRRPGTGYDSRFGSVPALRKVGDLSALATCLLSSRAEIGHNRTYLRHET